MKEISIGIIGAGFAAGLHAEALRRLVGIDARIIAIAGRNRARAVAFQERFGLESAHYYSSAEELIATSEAKVIVMATPTFMHVPLSIAAIRAGKSVICEKPLTGYFGDPAVPLDQRTGVGEEDRAVMLRACLKECQRLENAVRESDAVFCYAENWVYAPPIAKARRLLESSGGTILEIRCGESHSGSHSPFAREWRYTGGGALFRNGAHPYGAALHLKFWEGMTRHGKPICPQSVVATTARYRDFLDELPREQDHVVSRPVDVEDWSSGIVTFEDGTNAVISANDVTLGGIDNWLNIYASNARIECRISQNDSVKAYAPTEREFAPSMTVEKIETTAGWSPAQPDEDWMTGYPFEMQDFLESVIAKRQPLSGLDLAIWCAKTMYCAYLSARTGRRIDIPAGYSFEQ